MGKFVIKAAKSGIKFDLKAGNGEVIASSQVYKSLVSAKNGIASVTANAAVAEIEDQTVEGFAAVKHPKFQIYQDKAGEFRFRLKAKNGQRRLQDPCQCEEGHRLREEKFRRCSGRRSHREAGSLTQNTDTAPGRAPGAFFCYTVYINGGALP